MQEIRVKRGETTRMATKFGCTRQTIRNALRGITEGERTEEIREDAMKYGGALVPRRPVQKKFY
ncbi:MAG: hypothetical protein LBJ72_02280 [Dysgonamonadaceae bacterium]|jgi:predicted transcriptional regulator|nr:hypothetical protein [Dysgonamonadaceae bacterium]